MEIATLQKKDWTLLAIAFADGMPLSPVQLQKSLFLFGELLPDEVWSEDFYEFEPYNYGPFCSAVYRDAEALAEAGLVQIIPSAQGYLQYSATRDGLAQRDRLCGMLTEDVVGYARQLIEWVRAQSFRGLLSEIYRRYPQYRVNSVFSD